MTNQKDIQALMTNKKNKYIDLKEKEKEKKRRDLSELRSEGCETGPSKLV